MEYAIDFGTSNTVVARQFGGEIETVKLQFGQPTAPGIIPSLVYVENAHLGKVRIGSEVSDQIPNFVNGRLFKHFKRGICQSSPGFLPELDGIGISWRWLGNCFLGEITKLLPELESLVFTVPINSYESYTKWLRQIDLGVEQIRLIDEPTAAALGYGIDRQQLEHLLVFDFGGGTLDLVWVQLQNLESDRLWLKWRNHWNQQKSQPIAKVLAKHGTNLGGVDLDYWILSYWHQIYGLSRNSQTLKLAEQAKIALSSQTAVEIDFEADTLKLERSQLEHILAQQGFFDQLEESLRQIKAQIATHNLKFTDLDHLLLVGGSSQLPAVKTWLTKYFSPEQIYGHKPLEAIAHGALNTDWQLQDRLYHSYGLRYWDKKYQRHNWHPLIKAGTALPHRTELTLGASTVDQTAIELVLGEMGEAARQVLFEQGLLISQASTLAEVQPLNDQDHGRAIAQLTPLGQPGSDRLKISFVVDQQRCLKISVFDLLTRQELLKDQPVIDLI
ncbi:MAG: Hsp70 family protein [Pseudanabaenaceae cyanobacterium bins.68]|nr:Hsp70 family protein [Pseudanabaenaceae cyanobacterium bins.68]